MKNYQTFPISKDFSCKVLESPLEKQLSDVIEKEVDTLWTQAIRKNNSLFNGLIAYLVSHNFNQLTLALIEYKYFFAKQYLPALKESFTFKPLAISCLTHTSKSVLFGLRGGQVTQYPLHYELAPSGAISVKNTNDPIDVKEQAACELYEEIGVDAAKIRSLIPKALIYDKENELYELYIDLLVEEGAEKHALPPNSEYQQILWLNYSELPAFLKQHRSKIIPLSLFLLSQ
jgi:hypothetical protein